MVSGADPTGRVTWSGDLAAVANAACFAGEMIALRRYRHVDLELAFVMAGFATCALCIAANGGFSVSLHDFALIAFMGCVQLGLPVFLLPRGARDVPAVQITLISLLERLLAALESDERVQLYGHPKHRTATVYFRVDGETPEQSVTRLAASGINAWHGHNYAWEVTRALDIRDSGSAIRLSLSHYSNAEDVERPHREVALQGELRQPVAAHQGGQVGPDRERPLGEQPVALVEDLVEDRQPLVGLAHLVGIGVHQGPPHLGGGELLADRVHLAAGVLHGLADLREQRLQAACHRGARERMRRGRTGVRTRPPRGWHPRRSLRHPCLRSGRRTEDFRRRIPLRAPRAASEGRRPAGPAAGLFPAPIGGETVAAVDS